MAKHHPSHDLFKEVKFISLFISHKLAYETECPLSPSLKPKSYPSGHLNVILSSSQDSTDASHENKNCYAMDISRPTLEIKRKDSIDEHGSFVFETPQESCLTPKSYPFWTIQSSSYLTPRASMRIATISWSSFLNFLRGWLSILLFTTNTTNPIVALWRSPCSLRDNVLCFVVKLGTIPPLIVGRWSSHSQA